MNGLLRTLSVLSAIETLSVLLLLGNLVTMHNTTLAAAPGPVHGALYLAAAAIALLGRGLSTRTRVHALIPVASGPLTMRNVAREHRRVTVSTSRTHASRDEKDS